jgi:hypothetical protein
MGDYYNNNLNEHSVFKFDITLILLTYYRIDPNNSTN